MRAIKRFFYTVMIPAVFLSACASVPESGGAQSHRKEDASYRTVRIDESLDFLDTEIEYPDFPAQSELSRLIKNSVESEWRSFRAFAQGAWSRIDGLNSADGGKKYPPFEYQTRCQVSYSGNLISVLVVRYVFSGGAHGSTTLLALNFDTDTKRLVKITEASGLKISEISEICRESLQRNLIDRNSRVKSAEEIADMRAMILAGTSAQAGNFDVFTLSGRKMTVYFEPYAVAPYAYGIQSVEIPVK